MQCQIAVIGNGAIGKAAALGLAQAGHDVVLIAPAVAAHPVMTQWDARVFALNRGAQELLCKLKVWDALDQQRVCAVASMRVADEGGAELLLDAYAAYHRQMAWIVEDQNLNQALDNALRFAPNLKIVNGRAASMTPDFSEMTLEDGKLLRAELWVGADGAHSWMRNQAQIGVDYRSYHQSGVVCNFACELPHNGVAHQWFAGEQGVVALLPLPGQLVSLVWSAPQALATQLMAESMEQIADRLAAFCQPQLGRLAPLPPGQARAFPLNFVAAHDVVAPRLALVGDAAHVVHPLAGQGMNLGFGDVAALIEAVGQRESWRECGDAMVLRRYASARKEQVLFMQLATDGMARLFASQLEPVKSLRNVGMQLMNRATLIKRRLIQHAMG